jgi:ATP-binding cassette subfamily B protein
MDRLSEYIGKKESSHIRNWTVGEIMLIINNVLQFLFVLVMVAAAIWFNQNKAIGVGSTIMVITLSNMLKDQLMWIGNHFNELMDYYGEVAEGLQEILAEHELTDGEQAKPLLIKDAAIEFKNVYFNYGNKSVFRGFNLKIKPGEKIGLVGESGAGKSTLVSIILRQHDLKSGEILIDGQDITEITQESLRENIAVVPQEPLLFHRDILENIRYGNLKADEDAIINASKSAQAHQFIMELPQAYQTMVGERGIKLSGGQRQRIAIARAILKNAPILILDEATSSLDSQSEAEIQKALKNLMKDKTVIAVAHRLSTIKALDRIIVIHKGQIVQDGSHEELLQDQGGVYKELWHKQVEGFI